VRRDRVFARYTERCGSERVPTLNPASFGKLVRIIFPNVQTRRLGVRGESKYHYVDLSLVASDEEDRIYPSTQPAARPSTSSGIKQEGKHLPEDTTSHEIGASAPDVRPPSRHSMETADFPVPHDSPEPENVASPGMGTSAPATTSYRLDCAYRDTAIIRIPIKGQSTSLVSALPALRPSLPATLPTYLAMPEPQLVSQSGKSKPEEMVLPDIAPYLAGTEHDAGIAQSLYHLYRSYCIDVIDSFRKCREKSFFNHHSAYNGKMTVPVSKLFNLECLAPWIQECDMRMYKQIARFTAPLVLQNVPATVWTTFDHIAAKLVSSIIASFEEKCPTHVVVAKTVPAARFANLLKKLKSANAATQQMSHLLGDGSIRTQMWLDLVAMVDPDLVLDDSAPPPDCFSNIQGVLKHDFRALVDPLPSELVTAAEEDPTSPYAALLGEHAIELPGVLSVEVLDQPMQLLDRWVSWLQCLPSTFGGHHPQCMLDWHSKFWRSILAQVGNNGATSFQAWWYAEMFTTTLLSWLAEMQGLLLSEIEQQKIDTRGQEKIAEASAWPSASLGKRKRDEHIGDVSERAPKRVASGSGPRDNRSQAEKEAVAGESTVETAAEPTLPEMPQNDPDETDGDMDDLHRGYNFALPSLGLTGVSSPLKMAKTPGRAGINDDSGIDLGLDIDPDGEREARKFNKKDWLLSSDPPEGGLSLAMGGVAA
jgi:regulatory factor X, other